MQSMEPTLFCSQCGAANTLHATRCTHCQQDLSPSSLSSSVLQQTSIGSNDQVFTLSAKRANTTPHTPAVTTGSILHGRYSLLEEIGSGGFGTVYKAHDIKKRNKLVAIKKISLAHLSAREMIEATDSFNREVTLRTGLQHKHLVQLHDHFTDPQHWYLVMDYIQGETLDEYIAKYGDEGKLPLEEVVGIALQLCDVLHYLHTKHNIIFRDLKPGNIMIDDKGSVALIDFGIARRFTPGKKKDTQPLGTPGYAPPEQYGKAQTTAQSDIYSLGATLHMLYTGIDAADQPPQDVQYPTPQTDAEEKFQIVLEEMLAVPMHERPRSIEIVRHHLYMVNSHFKTRHTSWTNLIFTLLTVIVLFLVLFPFLAPVFGAGFLIIALLVILVALVAANFKS